MATSENWQLFVHNGRHNHKICLENLHVVAKIKKNRMQGRNTVEEVLCQSAPRDYMVFYRNREESNVLSDIVVAHPISIAMIRTYKMPLLKTIGMTPTGKNFTVATGFMYNEQATIYRWVLQQIKHLYVTSAMANGPSSILNKGEPLVILTDRESGIMPKTHRSECIDKVDGDG
ncbi:hypothetical protein M9H77_29600 [Catharanthus roseus]|uniref:Uncharacterized protein n=1 Tax=Catharanthus roseus TaxID=4058 RepID=A0ACB9ZX36_CATRO|nr:hypothetical protein M9H77_29600 [Catharanthus roseus]